MDWIDFGSGRKRALDFRSYEVGPTNGLPSQPKFCLITKFDMNDNVRIVNDKGEEVDVSDSLIVIDATCSLKLETTSDIHIVTFNLYMQSDRRMRSGGTCLFKTFINAEDAEELSREIKGESVRIGWTIEGYASIPNKQYAFPMPFEVGNLTDDKNKWVSIAPEQFSKNFIQRLGLREEYITTFPLKIPASIASSTNLQSGTKGLAGHLNTLVTSLSIAVGILRNAGTNLEYRQVMEHVKTSTNTIFQYVNQNKENLAKELFIDTGVISDIDFGGAKIAAEDVLEQFGKILQSIYLISSKPAHTTPQKGQPQLGFNFLPDRSDAEFVLTMGLTSAKYLLNKITNLA
ncbi:MAG: hypothetical protein WBF33_23910 [Candidatus Nitrosopolaris sp.]|jgi:hypothetical protein